jgi:transposase, IS5 family
MPTRSTQHGRLTSNAVQMAADNVVNCPVRLRADGRLEPCAGKLACTVLRGVRAGNGARLPDGKARTPYEFGVKVSITTTHKEGLVIGARSMPGNPYDGHTLAEALEQAAILSDVKPEVAIVDRGYKGVAVEGVKIYHPGLRRGITRGLRAMIRRRSAIEPAIGHMKADGKLDRNWLKGALGDAIHAVLCGAGHNLRMILRRLRFFCAFVLIALLSRETTVVFTA